MMDAKILASGNVTWLDIVGRQGDASRPICVTLGSPELDAATSSAIMVAPVPMLDWPGGLFDDVNGYN